MVLASNISVYIKGIRKAIADDQSVLPFAGPLGMSRCTAIAGRESVHASRIASVCVRAGSQASALRGRFAACPDSHRSTGDFPLCEGGIVEFGPLCVPMTSSAGDEWVFSSAGIQFHECRVRLIH